MTMQWASHQFKLEYDQKIQGYSGDLPEHWGHHVETFDSKAKAQAAVERLNAYVEQMAENHPGQLWVRNVMPVMRRDVAYSDWGMVQL